MKKENMTKNTKDFGQAQVVLANLIGDKEGRFTLLPVTGKRAKSILWAIAQDARLKWNGDGTTSIPFEVSMVVDRATMEKALCKGVEACRYYLATGKCPSSNGSKLSEDFKMWVKCNPLSGDKVVALNALYEVFCKYLVGGNEGGKPTAEMVSLTIQNTKTGKPITRSFKREDADFLLSLGGWRVVTRTTK